MDELAGQDLARRLWERDHTLWRDDPTEIEDRLGWLTVADEMRRHVLGLQRFAEECSAAGLTTAVLAGMGGSSLAPEVMRDVIGRSSRGLDLVVLDTTHPDEVRAVDRSIDVDRTLFVIASKSGTTTETLAHLAHFWERVPDGARFVAITDPGSPLEATATELGFRRVFANPPDIGGRYSALSFFGLVLAALLGIDLDGLLAGASTMQRACGAAVSPAANPGAWLGAVLGEAALRGRDKLTLALDEGWRSFGYWVEQLVAESTGKEGRGILPVEGEEVGPPDVYGEDRLFVAVGGETARRAVEPLAEAGHPAVWIEAGRPLELGGEFFRWEFATAVAGAVLRIQPFDQPNVQEAKDATGRILSTGHVPPVERGELEPLLASVRPGDYVALQAYLPRTPAVERDLHGVRMRLRDRLRVATTVGFGPRFLHSTGQLHKGGPNTGVFIQVAEPPEEDLPIPGRPYTFGTLLAAQAAGDLDALRSRGRRAVRVGLAELGGV